MPGREMDRHLQGKAGQAVMLDLSILYLGLDPACDRP